ncbi:hypothetical protein E2C01_101486 [Portunus trituberculatus]|uniref:Uncharacterized protein n=1 Tax=Portunus trituberculatus TaxID=210409 RepID=A0A5B7KFU5_PORTR|nr:hypothetical protein [Portunus trituberculatus]
MCDTLEVCDSACGFLGGWLRGGRGLGESPGGGGVPCSSKVGVVKALGCLRACVVPREAGAVVWWCGRVWYSVTTAPQHTR